MNLKRLSIIIIFLILFIGCLNNITATSNLTDEEIGMDSAPDDNLVEINNEYLKNDTANQGIEKESSLKESDNEYMEFEYIYSMGESDDKDELNSNVTNDTEAAIGFEKLNEYRTAKGTWYWSSNDQTIVYFNTNDNNHLLPLFWDDELAKCAKIRAEELGQLYSHQRPNGQDWSTAYPEYCYSENIAIGVKASSIEIFKETSAKYDGQQHRRNMLKNWNCVGIAGFISEGIGYCVQAFGWNEKYVIKNNQTHETISLNSTQGNFTELNNLINGNSEIELKKDYYYLNENDFRNGILITNSITINGHGHKIDGNNKARIFKINAENVTLKNIIFINGNEDYGYGGAIYCNQSNIIIENCSFINGISYYGGAVYFEKCNATIMKSNFTNNFAVEGAIYSNEGLLSIRNCDFTDNYAVLKGGAIYTNTNSTIEKNKFNSNKVDFYGGGVIYSADNKIKINYNVFSNNNAITYDGGAIYLNNVETSIENNLFINNTAIRYGGAICACNSTFNLTESNLFNNSINTTRYYIYGGAIYLQNSNVRILKSNFSKNSITSDHGVKPYGGAIYTDKCNASIIESYFDSNSILSNTLNGDGGAIYSEESRILIITSNFTNNNVNSSFNGDGGAIASRYNNITIINCIFIKNTGIKDGGAICTRYDTIYVEGCDFINNTLSLEYSQGGAIYTLYTNGTILKSNFFNNTCVYSGHAIKAIDSDIVAINSTFYKKYTARGNVTLINCTITNNPSLNHKSEPDTLENTTNNRKKTYLELFEYYGFVNQSVTLSARLWDANENYWLTGENIEFMINDERYPSFTQGQLGVSIFRYAFNKAGTYYFSVNYNGNEEYSPCNSTGKIIIKNPIEPQINTDLNFNNATITVDLGKNIEGEIIVNIDDSDQKWSLGYIYNEYKLKIQNGKAVLKLNNLKDRTYHFTVELNSTLYEFEEIAGSEFKIVTYKTYLVADDMTIFAGNELIYHIELYDEEEIGFENQTIHIFLNNRQYDLKTDENGTANLHVNLTSGNYPIIIAYDGFNNTFLPIKLSKNIIIKPTTAIPQNSEFAPNSPFDMQLFDRQGNILANTEIEVEIDGLKQKLTTDTTGKLSIILNLKDGKHTIQITNPKTGEIIKKEITIKSNNNKQQPQSKSKKIDPKKIIRTKNISVKKGKKIIFKAKLYNTKGKILKGKKVTFKFKGKKYKVKTNKKGVATLKLKIKLKKGKYTIKTTYQKYTVKNKIRIK